MFPFPKQSIEFTFKVKQPQPDHFGNDVYSTTTEVVTGVLLDEVRTADLPEPHQNHDSLVVSLDLPATYQRKIKGATFVALTGKLQGRVFEVDGDPVGLNYSPLEWDRSLIAVEVYGG